MTSRPSAAAAILENHLNWVGRMHQVWKRRDDMYNDKYWRDRATLGGSPVVEQNRPSTTGATLHRSGSAVRVQQNHYKPNAVSYQSSLYYSGVRYSVSADELQTPGQQLTQQAGAVRQLCNRFANQSQADMATVAEELTLMGLIYEGGAAMVVEARSEEEYPDLAPEDRLRVLAVPPWEAVWDRMAPRREDLRGLGRIYQMPLEAARTRFGQKVSADNLMAPHDWLCWGRTDHRVQQAADVSYVWIYEFVNLTESWEVQTSEGDSASAPGVLEIYQIDSISRFDAKSADANPTLMVELFRGPTPASNADGTPGSHIFPYLPDPKPGHKMDSAAVIESVYELNTELNAAMSVLAEAFRRDANRVIFYDQSRLSDAEVSQMLAADDVEFVGVNGGAMEGLIKLVEVQPVSSTLLTYIQHVREGIQTVQLTADVSRGKAGEYLSATESAALVAYTETTIGRIKRVTDLLVARTTAYAMQRYAVLLDGSSLKVSVGDSTITLTPEVLRKRWVIQVLDTAATPSVAAQRVADFIGYTPLLTGEAAKLGPEAEAQMAVTILDHLQRIAQLPEEFSGTSILAQIPPAPAPEEQLPAGTPGSAEPPVPQDVQAELAAGIADTPEGQAVLQAAAAEGVV